MKDHSRLLNRLALLAIAGGFATSVLVSAGCNTVKGVGKDITAVGEAGQDAIKKD